MAVETAPAESLPAPAASPSEVPANPVTTADLNLRAGPSFGDSVLMVIPAGAALAPTGEWSQGFVGVTYEGNYGWVDSGWLAAGEPGVDTAPQPAAATKDVALLQEVAPAPVTAAEPAPTKDAALVGDLSAVPGETAYATDVVNLRAGPSESSEVLRVLPAGRPGDDHRRAEQWLDASLVQRHHRLHQRQSPLRVHDNAANHDRAGQPGAGDGADRGAARRRGSGCRERLRRAGGDHAQRCQPARGARDDGPDHGHHPGWGHVDRAGGTGAGLLSGAVRPADRLGLRGVPPGLGDLSATG